MDYFSCKAFVLSFNILKYFSRSFQVLDFVILSKNDALSNVCLPFYLFIYLFGLFLMALSHVDVATSVHKIMSCCEARVSVSAAQCEGWRWEASVIYGVPQYSSLEAQHATLQPTEFV